MCDSCTGPACSLKEPTRGFRGPHLYRDFTDHGHLYYQARSGAYQQKKIDLVRRREESHLGRWLSGSRRSPFQVPGQIELPSLSHHESTLTLGSRRGHSYYDHIEGNPSENPSKKGMSLSPCPHPKLTQRSSCGLLPVQGAHLPCWPSLHPPGWAAPGCHGSGSSSGSPPASPQSCAAT